MRISIAIATRNGDQYLAEQLNSLINQSLKPDEIIISDDASNDHTPSIIRQFERNTSIKVKYSLQKESLGIVRNFENAIRHCSGDLIFLSDQDDVWEPNKLEVYTQYFAQHPDCNLLFSDAYIVDSNLESIGQSYWDSCAFNRRKQQDFKKHPIQYLTEWCYTLGMTIAVRNSMLTKILPAPLHISNFEKFMLHDGYLPYAMETLHPGTVHLLPGSYVKYRQHPGQTIGKRRTDFVYRFKKVLYKLINRSQASDFQKQFDTFHQNLNLYLSNLER